MDFPSEKNITTDICNTGMRHINLRVNGIRIGIVRKLSKGFTFTSDDIGSFVLPKGTTVSQLPELVGAFFGENKSKWVKVYGNNDTHERDDEYPHYHGESDPRLNEPEDWDDVDNHGHVECSNGCGYWAGQYLTENQCPECGSDCNEVSDEHFDD